MPSASPVKTTSGGGYAFEDQVGAFLAAALLAGEPLLGTDVGPAFRIDFQVGVDGWELDDVLVTFASRVRWCVSVKSSRYIGPSVPRDFAERAWKEIAGVARSGFDRGRDLIGVVTAPLDPGTFGHLQELIRLSREQDPVELDRRIEAPGYVSSTRQQLWSSLKAPSTVATPTSISTSPGEVLSRLRALELDFELSPSRALADALRLCKQALVDSDGADALWADLLAIVRATRIAGGFLHTPKLLSRLQAHRLRRAIGTPAATAERLFDESSARLIERWLAARVDESMAESLALDSDVGRLPMALGATGLIALVGDFGSGKSVAAERIHQTDIEQYDADPTQPLPVYLRARNVKGALDEAVRSFAARVGAGRCDDVRLILDGLDELGIGRGTELLSEARELARANPRSRVIVTTRPALYVRDQERIEVPALTDEAISSLGLRLHGRPFWVSDAPPAVREAVKRPLFALIALSLRQQASALPSSRARFIEALVRRALGDTEIGVLKSTELLATAASTSLPNDGWFTAADVGGPDVEAQLLDTRLIVREGDFLRFALPIIEQCFGAHALLNGLVDVDTVMSRLDRFEPWRYAFVVAVGVGPWHRITELVTALGRVAPGGAAWAVSEAVSEHGSPDADDAGARTLPTNIECAQRLRHALSQWLDWLGPIKALTSLVDDDGRPLAVGAGRSGTQVTAVLDGSGLEADVFDLLSPGRLIDPFGDRSIGPVTGGRVPAGEQAWPWRRSMEWAAADVIRTLKHRALPLPHNEALVKEREWALARLTIDEQRMDHPPIDTSRLVRAGERILTELAPTGCTSVTFRRSKLSFNPEEITTLVASWRSRSEPLQRPWPVPDKLTSSTGWIDDLYTPQRMALLVEGVYGAALTAYRDLVDIWFPHWGQTLGWASMMPVQLVLHLREPTDTGSIRAYALDLEAKPVTSEDPSIVLSADPRSRIQMFPFNEDEWVRRRHRLAELRPETSSWSKLAVSTGITNLTGDMPATDLAYKWLWRDLHDVGFLHEGP